MKLPRLTAKEIIRIIEKKGLFLCARAVVIKSIEMKMVSE